MLLVKTWPYSSNLVRIRSVIYKVVFFSVVSMYYWGQGLLLVTVVSKDVLGWVWKQIHAFNKYWAYNTCFYWWLSVVWTVDFGDRRLREEVADSWQTGPSCTGWKKDARRELTPPTHSWSGIDFFYASVRMKDTWYREREKLERDW